MYPESLLWAMASTEQQQTVHTLSVPPVRDVSWASAAQSIDQLTCDGWPTICTLARTMVLDAMSRSGPLQRQTLKYMYVFIYIYIYIYIHTF